MFLSIYLQSRHPPPKKNTHSTPPPPHTHTQLPSHIPTHPQGKITLADAEGKLSEFGFPPELQRAPLSSLSGGWRMKLALAQAMLTDPDMLLLDEPTNHLGGCVRG